MITIQNTNNLIKSFSKGLTSGFETKDEFLSSYYRALLCNSNVRFLKRHYQSGDFLKLRNKLEELLNSTPPSEKDFDIQFNLTLYNIIKYHLDEFIGRENTEKNLEEIHIELNRITNLIFQHKPPFNLHVEDTTNLRDESKTEGSHFSVRIVPHQLLF